MYRVEITSQGDASFTARSQGYEFNISNKEREGVSPPAALLAGLGGCIGVYARKYLEGAGIAASGFNINLEAEIDKGKPVCFKVINVSIDLGGVFLDARRKEAFLSFIMNCPVHNTLKANPEVKVAIV